MATEIRTDQVSVEEFRENLDHFLRSTSAVRIVRDGEIIGVFTPVPRLRKFTPEEADERALELARRQDEFLRKMEEAGFTEEDLPRNLEELERQEKRSRRG